MEVLVQWFTDNLSQRRSAGGISFEGVCGESNSDLHYRKYYSYTIYITVYSSDF